MKWKGVSIWDFNFSEWFIMTWVAQKAMGKLGPLVE